MASFLRSPSQSSSSLQQAIEKVTDPNKPGEDWALIMQLCDYVGAKDDSAKEAMKILRKRLQINPTNPSWRTIELTLTLLEAFAKNCGKIFHIQIAHRDFLKELKGILGPKNSPPLPIQRKVLGMIQTWALAFRHDPDLKNVEHFYQECKQQGLEFPPADPENVIKTAVPATATIERPLQSTRSMPQPMSATATRQNRPGMSFPVSHPQPTAQTMTADQVAKLRSELDVVQTNAQVFGEMLVTLQPGDENPQDFELLMDLHKTCKQMQARIVDLLSQISIDDITVDLLRYNDEFNNSFRTFDSYMQERERRFRGSSQPSVVSRTASLSPTKQAIPTSRVVDNVPALIRFDDEPATLTTGFQNMHLSSTSASAIPKPLPLASTPSAITRAMPNIQDPEYDVREVEQWLKTQGDESDSEEPSHPANETTAAFNNFLQKRASTIPDDSKQHQLYMNIQPTSNRIDQNSSRM